jgi:hypothetical protein
MLWEWIGLGICFFLARQLLTTPREVRAIVAVMVALAVGIACYGVYQWRWEIPQTLAIYKANPDRAMHDAGLSFPPDSPTRKLFEDRLKTQTPAATFALSNSLAAFLAAWVVILGGITGVELRDARHRRRGWGMCFCIALLALCLLLTKGRSGCVAALDGRGARLAQVGAPVRLELSGRRFSGPVA